MKLDAHPKAMAFIMLAIGILGIGIILTLGFYTNDTLLGIGVTMSVLGGAASILGCVNLAAQRRSSAAQAGAGKGPAPNRVPPISPIRSRMQPESAEAVNGGQLVYEPCSVSPSPNRGAGMDELDGSRVANAITGIVPPAPAYIAVTKLDDGQVSARRAAAAAAYPLSPFDQRSFPVPAAVLTMPQEGGDASGLRRRTTADSGIDGGSGYTKEELERELARVRQGGGGTTTRRVAIVDDDDDRLPQGYWSPAERR